MNGVTRTRRPGARPRREPGPVRHDNARVLAVLREIEQLLEERGDGPFRAMAYRRAIAAIEGLDHPVSEVLDRDGLKGLDDIPGIGPGIAWVMSEIVDTGRSSVLRSIGSQGSGPNESPGFRTRLRGASAAIDPITTLAPTTSPFGPRCPNSSTSTASTGPMPRPASFRRSLRADSIQLGKHGFRSSTPPVGVTDSPRCTRTQPAPMR